MTEHVINIRILYNDTNNRSSEVAADIFMGAILKKKTGQHGVTFMTFTSEEVDPKTGEPVSVSSPVVHVSEIQNVIS